MSDAPMEGEQGLYELRVTDTAGAVVASIRLDREGIGGFLEVLSVGLFAEGIHDDEGGPVSDKPRITINIPPGQPQCPSCGWFNGKHRDDCAEEAVRLRRRKQGQS